MSDITGGIVALIALKKSGIVDALKDPSKKFNFHGNLNKKK